MTEFTTTQKERLRNLGAPAETIRKDFTSLQERNDAYRSLEKQLAADHRSGIHQLLREKHRTAVTVVTERMEAWLMERAGFTKVLTPTMIPFTMLDKMTVTEDHALREQVYSVGDGKCLRPMLAPGLYVVMRELRRITGEPVRIFETGSCFRRDSQGARHLNEFTMLNLVELAGVEDGQQPERLTALAKQAMEAIGIQDYQLEREASSVYGETLDITVGGMEVASGSTGPHPLDGNWGVFDPWVGIGLGLERLAMALSGVDAIKSLGRSTGFLGGYTLSV